MAHRPLQDVGVLVVEDDYFIASDLARTLTDLGARVIGPFGRLEQARAALRRGPVPAVAILDINLAGTPVYPLAEDMCAAGIPFVFATGYDARIVPAEFDRIPRLVKPIEYRQLAALLGRAIDGA